MAPGRKAWCDGRNQRVGRAAAQGRFIRPVDEEAFKGWKRSLFLIIRHFFCVTLRWLAVSCAVTLVTVLFPSHGDILSKLQCSGALLVSSACIV